MGRTDLDWNGDDADHVIWPGQPWRRCAPISDRRASRLRDLLQIEANIAQDSYPFKGETLDRADIEWLISDHQTRITQMAGQTGTAANWRPLGLDLRGATLRDERGFNGLPLAGLRGGLTDREARGGNRHRQEAAANLKETQLDGADLRGAILAGTNLSGAKMHGTLLQGADLTYARLVGADLRDAHLEGAILRHADLAEPPAEPQSQRAAKRTWRKRKRRPARAPLPADLRGAYFDDTSDLVGACLVDAWQTGVRVADARWRDVNLAGVNWDGLYELADEYKAGEKGTSRKASDAHHAAIRACRQLAIVLERQGLTTTADSLDYNARVLERPVLRWKRWWGRWFLALLLDAFSGYGYYLHRIFYAYIGFIMLFAATYALLGVNCAVTPAHATAGATSGCDAHPMHILLTAVVLSITAFHGRVFSVSFGLGSPLGVTSAAEAIVGLVIESIFIAMLIERFFGR